MIEDRLDLLRQSPLWKNLPVESLQAVCAAMQPAPFRNGETILRQGEQGMRFHVLTSGRVGVRIRTAGGIVVDVAELRPGDAFGEMSLLTGDPASADVVALEDSETLSLDRGALNALVASHPNLLREFVAMVSRRLRTTDEAVADSREMEQELTRFLREERTERESVLVGKEKAKKELERRIAEEAHKDGPLLIAGERGTGKELIASLIHYQSARKDAPLLCADGAKITQTQWGDQLFGDYHRKDGRPHPRGVCYMDLAEGGTLLLKNADALPPPVTERLVRFLERDVGDPAARRRNVRILATCRNGLAPPGAEGASRLPAVLAAAVLQVPPLRERKRDIPDLARHFLEKHARRLGKPVKGFEEEAMIKLVSYDYAIGNVGELEEAVERAVVLAAGETIIEEEIFLGPPPRTRSHGLNLLHLPQPVVDLALWLYPSGVRVLAAAVFAAIVALCFFGPRGSDGNLGTLLVWSVWWPALVVSFFFAGRAWCAICPMALAAEKAQEARSLGRRIPNWVKQHEGSLLMAGFFAILWLEEVTAMRHSPLATGLLLIFILAGAVISSVLYQRRSWCRHLCPLGAFAGLCSTSSMVELRPTLDVCTAKCGEHLCYKGGEHAPGCPMFLHVMFVDSNHHCTLCLNCIRSCANNSPQINLRFPGRDLWTVVSGKPEAGRFVAMVLGLLLALVMVEYWERFPTEPFSWLVSEQRFLFVSLLMLSIAVAHVGVVELVHRRLGPSPDSASADQFWKRVTAFTPLLGAGFAAYQLLHIPGLDRIRTHVEYVAGIGQAVPWLSSHVNSILQLGLLTVGLLLTLVTLWKLREVSGGSMARTPLREWFARGLGTAGIGLIVGVLLVGPPALPGLDPAIAALLLLASLAILWLTVTPPRAEGATP